MNHGTYLSWVVDDVLQDAYARQHEAACATTMRYFVRKEDSMVGMERYGVLDFVIRLIHEMRNVHGVKWTPRHDKFVINDFSCLVNRQGLIQEMRDLAKTIPVVQIPNKQSKMTRVIAANFGKFEEELGKALPAGRRYYRLTLMAMYVNYIGKMMGYEEEYERIKQRVTECKLSFLPAIARIVRGSEMRELMRAAQEITFRDLDDARNRFKSF